MAKVDSIHLKHASRHLTLLGAIVLTTALLHAAPAGDQQTFATPQDAIQATITASDHNDTPALLKIFGPDGRDIVLSGDPSDDESNRKEFARLAHEKVLVNQDPVNPDRATFSVGEQNWPLPVPLVRRNGKWEFDSAKGRIEILAHRIGENELNAVEVSRGYVEAQLEYAVKDRNGSGLLQYAQKIISSAGKHDGLYSDGDPESLVPKSFGLAAASEATAGTLEPYHGYYFRILKAQGPDAAGGPFNYVVDGKMFGGFALIAWPAEYGVSGIQSFIVSHHGVVYGKDLGAATANLARQITRFNPDKSWHQAGLE
jgi:hypothetical protein